MFKKGIICLAFILGLCLTGIMSGCSGRLTYVSSDQKVVEKEELPDIRTVCDMKKLKVKSSDEDCIYIDLNTNVLYYKYQTGYWCGITPVMKADGTCLTYDEWKSNLEKNK